MKKKGLCVLFQHKNKIYILFKIRISRVENFIKLILTWKNLNFFISSHLLLAAAYFFSLLLLLFCFEFVLVFEKVIRISHITSSIIFLSFSSFMLLLLICELFHHEKLCGQLVSLARFTCLFEGIRSCVTV